MTTYYKGFPQSTREEKLHMVNLNELENEAKYVIPEAAYYYIASGAENEWTWRNNTQAFNHFQIVPRALTGMQDPELNTEFLGMKLKTPVMICPIACHGIANAEAEIDTAKGAKAAGSLFGMSTYANKSVQEVQAAVGDSPRYMQLYLSKNWDFNKMVIEESVKAGFTGFFLTVDALVSGYREETCGLISLILYHLLSLMSGMAERVKVKVLLKCMPPLHKILDQTIFGRLRKLPMCL